MELMVTDTERQEFSDRLNKALDGIGYPTKGKGRQTKLGEDMEVTQKGARKWLEAEAIPHTTTIMRLAKKCRVRFDWLATGRGAMREDDAGSQTVEDVDFVEHADVEASESDAINAIRQTIDHQHRRRGISDDSATLLRAALQAAQGDIDPAIRAAILLMLGNQTSIKQGKDASDRRFKKIPTASNLTHDKEAESPVDLARRKIADARSATKPEDGQSNESGSAGT